MFLQQVVAGIERNGFIAIFSSFYPHTDEQLDCSDIYNPGKIYTGRHERLTTAQDQCSVDLS